MHVAAAAIQRLDRVVDLTADSDHRSGEIIFAVRGTIPRQWFILKLADYE